MVRRFLTERSVWLIDEDRSRYMRLPKIETPRAAEFSWRLADGQWIDFVRWTMSGFDPPRLQIWTEDAVYGIYSSPIVSEEPCPA